jgi:hypothetical protein
VNQLIPITSAWAGTLGDESGLPTSTGRAEPRRAGSRPQRAPPVPRVRSQGAGGGSDQVAGAGPSRCRSPRCHHMSEARPRFCREGVTPVGINLDAALARLGPASIAVSIVRPDGGLQPFG